MTWNKTTKPIIYFPPIKLLTPDMKEIMVGENEDQILIISLFYTLWNSIVKTVSNWNKTLKSTTSWSKQEKTSI
jgi:hypothetical protein